jgi:hypothetical protein
LDRACLLELLIVVPCHAIIWHRDILWDPVYSAFAVSTGIVTMLISLYPRILLRFKSSLRASLRDEGAIVG